MADETTEERRELLEILRSIRDAQARKKGALERLTMVAALLTPLVIAGGGWWVTTRVEAAKVEEQRIARQQAAEDRNLQIIVPFLPYLMGNDEAAQQRSIETILKLGNAELAAYAASIRPSTGSARGLQAIATAPGLTPVEKQRVDQALRSLPDSILRALTPVPSATGAPDPIPPEP